jgi:hypothetical protein
VTQTPPLTRRARDQELPSGEYARMLGSGRSAGRAGLVHIELHPDHPELLDQGFEPRHEAALVVVFGQSSTGRYAEKAAGAFLHELDHQARSLRRPMAGIPLGLKLGNGAREG